MTLTNTNNSIYRDLCDVLPGGVNSPIRACKGLGQEPMVAERGDKDCIYDVEGKKFIDYCCSWGPLIHGHAHPLVLKAAIEKIYQGTSFGITTEIEGQLAKKIISLMPNIEKMRFVSSGTEACMSVARLARAFTRRNTIVKFSGHYHGHADLFLIQAGSGVVGTTAMSTSAGIPEEVIKHTVCLPFNDFDTVQRFFSDPQRVADVAAVIVEPVACNMGVVAARAGFLELLRSETQKCGALLIFDEVITGFRLGLQGAQGLYGIVPDLTCLGKIIGGGFPAAAFGGRAEIMNLLAPLGPVYQAGTLSGNPVAMAAGLKTIDLLEEDDGFYFELERKANLITQPVREWIENHGYPASIQQVGSLFTIFFGMREVNSMEEAKKGLDTEAFAHFYRYMYKQGVYVPPWQYEAWFISSAHTDEHLEMTATIILEYLNDCLNQRAHAKVYH